jgi:malate dehydrogenase (oxaloacetate-decarboxylating)(NADP+)
MNKYKDQFATEFEFRTLEDAVDGADCFIGVSVKGALSQKMVKSMAKDPIIFALANPDPEILPSEAMAIRSDCIVATGRSDLPNQVNNVLGFPSIFRGALDTHARGINEEMKMAAVKAIAALTKEEIPEHVKKVYGADTPKGFGRDYLIPKPVDNRLLKMVAPAVAEAAIRTGVARKNINIAEYKKHIEEITRN